MERCNSLKGRSNPCVCQSCDIEGRYYDSDTRSAFGRKGEDCQTRSKEKVFVTNALRALTMVAPTGNIREMEFVVLVGGSALDFEIPQLVTDALSQYSIVAGRGNIRGTEGPRNAVATGLILALGEGGGLQ